MVIIQKPRSYKKMDNIADERGQKLIGRTQ